MTASFNPETERPPERKVKHAETSAIPTTSCSNRHNRRRQIGICIRHSHIFPSLITEGQHPFRNNVEQAGCGRDDNGLLQSSRPGGDPNSTWPSQPLATTTYKSRFRATLIDYKRQPAFFLSTQLPRPLHAHHHALNVRVDDSARPFSLYSCERGERKLGRRQFVLSTRLPGVCAPRTKTRQSCNPASN